MQEAGTGSFVFMNDLSSIGAIGALIDGQLYSSGGLFFHFLGYMAIDIQGEAHGKVSKRF